ncbi:orotate phosphoribosyltransferase [Bacillus sp. FJAT-47783]|uniref:orotate phosphoribosyltransferase n=1 Tax=Bacillus sp. FJAT-47783 TaxID=2922712 RepID=UPI001FAD4160|nr:orotate phosphoribosyltransferase [Bacillus sp. FJAT-47783]
MKQQLAKDLLSIGAVLLRPNDPFTWASGIKSPIYCDNRMTLSFPEVRKHIYVGLSELIEAKFPEAEVIAGTATAGIPHAALVSEKLNLPMCYVRSSPKGHGKGNQIEGKVEKGQKVVVVEDLISTGQSALKVVDALRNEGCEVLGIVSIFTYQLQMAKENIEQANIESYSLCDYDTLVQIAKEERYISEEDVNKLSKWRKNHKSEEWMAV